MGATGESHNACCTRGRCILLHLYSSPRLASPVAGQANLEGSYACSVMRCGSTSLAQGFRFVLLVSRQFRGGAGRENGRREGTGGGTKGAECGGKGRDRGKRERVCAMWRPLQTVEVGAGDVGALSMRCCIAMSLTWTGQRRAGWKADQI